MQQLERKADGEMRPRIESWKNVAGHLRRLVKPKLGKMIASEVTRQDIAELSNDSGRYSALASSHGARIQTSRSSSVVNITGMPSGGSARGSNLAEIVNWFTKMGTREAHTFRVEMGDPR
ncbi:hypothetical protein [Bradyrhizobium sp. USDA 10063]